MRSWTHHFWLSITLLIAQAGGTAAAASAQVDQGDEPFTPAEYAASIRRTVEDCTVDAALGPARISLPVSVSNFLLDHPDLATFIVRRHHIAAYSVVMQGLRRSLADDGAGTRGIVNLIAATNQHRLYYGEGVHHSRLFPDIRATAVIVMDLNEEAPPDLPPCTVIRFHVWVRMKNRFVSHVVKTLHPLLQGTIIRKFNKAFSAADAVGRLTARDPNVIAEDCDAFSGLFVENRATILRLLRALRGWMENKYHHMGYE